MGFGAAEDWRMAAEVIDAIGGIGSLLAAVAAWFAALGSMRAVKEMQASRNQDVKPILIFEGIGEVEIDLIKWVKSQSFGVPQFPRALRLKNVGKGPAFGIKHSWVYCPSRRTDKAPIDTDAINHMLDGSEIYVEESDQEWKIRVQGSDQSVWSIFKYDIIHSETIGKLEE